MKDKAFLDSNVLIYLYSADEAAKRQQACNAVEQNLCITSVQALNEFSNVCLRKFHTPPDAISNAIDEIEHACGIIPIDTGILKHALTLYSRYGYAYYDCLMLASALREDCKYIFTEDMQHGHVIEQRLTIRNPFI